MKRQINKFRIWFEQRNLREKFFVLALSWAVLYAIFSLFLFIPLEKNKKTLMGSIKTNRDQILNWELQLDALNKISQTPLYKEWSVHNKNFQYLRGEYKSLLAKPSSQNWQDIIKTILHSKNNVTLDQIKNFPETEFQPANIDGKGSKIYQQQLLLVIYSNYFDTISYLKKMESTLPNIHWNSLKYEVTEYPVGKVEMEFSMLYEKHD